MVKRSNLSNPISKFVSNLSFTQLYFSEGETTYDLRDAQILRVKIAKIGENVDNISKRIPAIGTVDMDSPPQGQALRLHQMVRASAMIFLKEQLLTIPPLPSEEAYLALQEKRQKRIEERVAFERQLEIEEALRERRKEQRLDKQSGQSHLSAKNNEVTLLLHSIKIVKFFILSLP